MKITTRWLKEYINTNLNIHEIIENLSNLGFELKEVISHPNFWSKVKIVQIVNKEKHPNADKLNIYSIKKENEEILKIICGDSTLEIGDYVPYLAPGIQMPSGIELTIKDIRGIESPGMLCSPEDLNLPIEYNGVLKCFAEDWGKSIAEAYEKEGIFEIELTPNKGDALSIQGIARILANANLGTFIEKPIKEYKISEDKFFDIQSKDCLGLLCTHFEHKIQKTPYEIVKKLQLTGHTVTDLDIVDMTNYVSHAIGQPMHVFDYDKISSSPCAIENLKRKQGFHTLADQLITLEEGTLVMTSGTNIISWPGIIGGEGSKVTKNTKSVLLETGVFITDSIQRRKNKIITGAAKKFEYGINPFALKDATFIFLNQLNISPTAQQYMAFEQTKKISFRFEKIEEITGIKISKEEFIKIMEHQGFKFNENDEVSPPNHKFFDITTENCIIEEFLIYQNKEIISINLPPKYAKTKTHTLTLSKTALLEGFHECKNISLDKKENEEYQIPLTNRQIHNFSNNNYSILRGSLIPGLLKTLSWHINKQENISSFFEEGIIYGDYPNKQKKYFTAISTNYEKIQTLLSKILTQSQHQIISQSEPNPYSSQSESFYINHQKVASISQLKKSILEKHNIQECYALELEPEILKSKPTIKTEEPSNLMPLYQDTTLTLAPETSASIITSYLNKKNIENKILTIFPENCLTKERKITIQIKLIPKTTLTKEEINQIFEKIIQNMKEDIDIS